MAVIVDTNVAVVAEGLSGDADAACLERCQDILFDITKSGGLLLDGGDAIVAEYVKTLGHAGRPGIGRAFAKWAFDHRYDPACCTLIEITERAEKDWRMFEEFPDDPRLITFDADDQMFVSVALASCLHPPILNAVDSDWKIHEEVLEAVGVRVEELCDGLNRASTPPRRGRSRRRAK